jgi:hypothetical protein
MTARKALTVVALLWLSTYLVSSARAESQQFDDDEWHIIAPTFYMWLFQTEGNLTLRGATHDADLSIGGVLDHSDNNFQIYVEVDKGDWGFCVEPTLLSFSGNTTEGGQQFKSSVDIVLVDFCGTYRVWRTKVPKPMSLAVLVGGRYWNVDTDVNGVGPAPDANAHLNIIDPILGARFRMDVTEKFQLAIRSDIGGFGLSDKESHLTWQAWMNVGYDVTKNFSVFGGYRALSVDYDEGRGINEKGADVTFFGPVIGLNFDIFGWLEDRKK